MESGCGAGGNGMELGQSQKDWNTTVFMKYVISLQETSQQNLL